MQAATAIDVKEVEQRVAELSALTGVELKLEKSKVFEVYHVYTRDTDGRFLGWVTRPLADVLYIVNVCIALERDRRLIAEGATNATL